MTVTSWEEAADVGGLSCFIETFAVRWLPAYGAHPVVARYQVAAYEPDTRPVGDHIGYKDCTEAPPRPSRRLRAVTVDQPAPALDNRGRGVHQALIRQKRRPEQMRPEEALVDPGQRGGRPRGDRDGHRDGGDRRQPHGMG